MVKFATFALMVKKCSSIFLLFALAIVFAHNAIPHYHLDHKHDLSYHHTHSYDHETGHPTLIQILLHSAHSDNALAISHIHSVSKVQTRYFLSLADIPSDFSFQNNTQIIINQKSIDFSDLICNNEDFPSSGLRGPPFAIS